MVTDLIHLNQFTFNFYQGLVIVEWMYFTFLISGVLLALYLLILMFIEIEHFTSAHWFNRILILIMMMLNGFGIYIGRFLRLHSVYLINEPLRIFREVTNNLNLDALLFITLLVLLQILIYAFAKGVRSAK
jgi:uncharacterized membrane protein